MRTLVLGLGNPVLSDDGVGLRVARALRPLLAGREDVDVDEDYCGGLRLMERMIGYDRGVVIDAIRSGGAPGTVHSLRGEHLPTQHSAGAHDVNLTTALGLGRRIGMHLPPSDGLLLIGIEAEDVHTFGEDCTPGVEAAIPRAVETVLEAVGEPDR